MKIFLAVILSPLYIAGFIIGFLFIPIIRGIQDGMSFIMNSEEDRINRVVSNEVAKRNLENETAIS